MSDETARPHSGPRNGSKMLYALHIPKTGGLSICALLRDFAVQRNKRLIGPVLADHLLTFDFADWRNADILLGHCGLFPVEQVPGLQIVTMLRHPVEHLQSWYWHVRRDPHHYFHEAVVAQRLTFEDWLDWPPARPLVDNPQARYLGTDPMMAGGRSGKKCVMSWELSSCALDHVTLEQAARATLRRAIAVGRTERLDEFQGQLATILEFRPTRVFRENTNPCVAAPVSERTARRIIEEYCSIDAALYESAYETRLAA